MSEDGPQGKEYSDYIKFSLEAEYKRRAEIDARAGTVVTSAGGLLTLTIAVFAVFLGSGFKLEGAERNWMAGAFILLLACASLGVFASISRGYEVADGDNLEDMVNSKWGNGDVDARNIVASLNVKTTISLREGNGKKYALLLTAHIAQTLSIAALGMSALYAFT